MENRVLDANMINVQPYHDKLDKLQEWINLLVDRQKGYLYLDIGGLGVMPPAEIMRIYHETGVLFGHPIPTRPPTFITFKEFYERNNA